MKFSRPAISSFALPLLTCVLLGAGCTVQGLEPVDQELEALPTDLEAQRSADATIDEGNVSSVVDQLAKEMALPEDGQG